MIKEFNKKGTTLIEILLYFVITAVVIFVFASFALQILTASSVSGNLNEIQTNADISSEKIVTSIKTATSVDTVNSIFDNDNGTLSLNMNQPTKSPTKFFLTNGDLFMQQGIGAATQINSSSVTYTKLLFHKISYNKNPDQIIIDAVIAPKNTEIANLKHERSIHLTVSLKNI